MPDEYYTARGRVKPLTSFHYLAVKGKTRKDLTFMGQDVEDADRKALRWCRKRGYKVYRKKSKHH